MLWKDGAAGPDETCCRGGDAAGSERGDIVGSAGAVGTERRSNMEGRFLLVDAGAVEALAEWLLTDVVAKLPPEWYFN